jgi:protein ImuA
MSRWETLRCLRAEVARIGRGGLAESGEGEALPLGVAEIDAALGEGGLRRGALHEISGTAATGFAAVVAGRAAWSGRPVLWCGVGRGRGGLYPPGLAMLGLPPSSLLLMDCRNERELLAAAEEGLRGGDLAALLLEVSRLPDMTAARRLQLAAETGGSLGLMLCPGPNGRHDAKWRRDANAPGAMAPDGVVDALPPSPAVSRWRVGHAPAGGQGHFRWRLALLRCRGGGHGEWMVDWNEKTLRLDLVSAAGD